MKPPSRFTRYVLRLGHPTSLLLLLLLAAVLRFYRLDYQSFWNDEGNSARLAERSTRLILEGAAGDIHPPGYYLLLKAWRGTLGESEWALRSLSAIAGLVTVALVVRLGKEYFDRRVAWFAGLFAATHPFLTYYSQEVRMYALVTALACASFLLTARLARPQTAAGRRQSSVRGRRPAVIGLIAVNAAGLYTHYVFGFILVAENLVFLIAVVISRLHNRKGPDSAFRTWTLVQVAALLLFLPWLPTAYQQLITWPAGRGLASAWESAVGVWSWLSFGPFYQQLDFALALLASGLLTAFGLARRGLRLPASLWLLVPASLTVGLGLISGPFAKVLIVAVPPLCLLWGGGAAAMLRRASDSRLSQAVSLATGGMAVVVLAGLGAVLAEQTFNPAIFRDDYRALARRIEEIGLPGDAAVLEAPNQWEVFTYYHRAGAPVYPLPRERPLVADNLLSELATITRDHRRLFVLYWGETQADPERVLERWLAENTFKAGEEWAGSVRFATYVVDPNTLAQTPSPLQVVFGGNLMLSGASLPQERNWSPGETLALRLYWTPSHAELLNYKVFLHLTADPAQPPAAQQDFEPVSGFSPTASWLPGQTYADNHGLVLPRDLASGEYELRVGLYNPADGRRLPVTSGGEGDSWPLRRIVVRSSSVE